MTQPFPDNLDLWPVNIEQPFFRKPLTLPDRSQRGARPLKGSHGCSLPGHSLRYAIRTPPAKLQEGRSLWGRLVRPLIRKIADIMAKSLELKRQVKLELAAKHKRLAQVAGSETKRKTWEFHARRFTNQAEAIAQILRHQEVLKSEK